MDHTVLLERWLELRHLLDGRAAPDALVLEDRVTVLILDRHDLIVERTGILCGRCLLVRAERELVEHHARKAPLLGDHLGADALVRRLAVAATECLGVRMPTVGQRSAHRGA